MKLVIMYEKTKCLDGAVLRCGTMCRACFWGWNQSITEGFTVLTAHPDPQDPEDEQMRMRAQEEPREDQAYTLSRSMDETDAAEICADADEEVLVSASSDVSADETLAAVRA